MRFKGYWDDLTKYGARLYFNIHYYLADNTMEFNEEWLECSSGRLESRGFGGYEASKLVKLKMIDSI